ncbi:MAG: ribonuclease R [bacterium]
MIIENNTTKKYVSKKPYFLLACTLMNNKNLIGTISINAKGRGFVRVEDREDDVMVDPQDISTALNRDTVEISTFINQWSETQGKIIRIVERSKTSFVGTMFTENGQRKLRTDDLKSNISITITNPDSLHDNTKVQVRVDFDNWKDGRNPSGEVIKVFGAKGDNNAEMEAIVAERGFDTTFSEVVLKEAAESAAKLRGENAEEMAKRKDFRQTWTCTIDPFDAKDFDDAISLKELENGDLEVGVHIADVSHFVREGTELDKEARKRAFSVYLVDRTIPMLPSILSTDVCSLNPNEDRFSFSAVFIMDKNANVKERWFGKTVIHSARRFTYEEAEERLVKNEGDCVEQLTVLNGIAKKMGEERHKHGAIDFETTEIKFKLDEDGKPIAVYKKERLQSHKLVEEFMLLANREVAKFIHDEYKNAEGKTLPGVYRIHDVPNIERLEDLGIFVRALGFEFHPHKNMKSKDIQTLLEEVGNSSAAATIKTATLRSMAKAEYSTKNIGHFGLAFTYYTQFTSPIRRYADLIVHRIMQSIGGGEKVSAELIGSLDKVCADCSKREVEAADAERTSIKYKQVEYMERKVGQILNVTVGGIAEWGMFVEEEESKAEGLIRLKDLLPSDFYSADTKNYVINGQRTKKQFKLGDKLKVKLIKADLDTRALELQIIE